MHNHRRPHRLQPLLQRGHVSIGHSISNLIALQLNQDHENPRAKHKRRHQPAQLAQIDRARLRQRPGRVHLQSRNPNQRRHSIHIIIITTASILDHNQTNRQLCKLRTTSNPIAGRNQTQQPPMHRHTDHISNAGPALPARSSIPRQSVLERAVSSRSGLARLIISSGGYSCRCKRC